MRPGGSAAQRDHTTGGRKRFVGAQAEFGAGAGHVLGGIVEREDVAADDR